MLDWDDLRVFLAVRRQGSHGAAGRALGVDPTTVGRRLAGLEEALGASLFRRGPGGLTPTDEGARLAAHAERIEQEVLASQRALRGTAAVSGVVRIIASEGLLGHALAPALGELLGRHPGLRVELRSFDMSRREADVAVRFSRPREAGLVVRRIGSARFRLYASDAYLARRGRPTSEAALAEHDLITHEARLDGAPPMAWLRQHAPQEVRVRSMTTTGIAAACAAGQGIGLTLQAAMRGVPGVVEVLPRADIPVREVWGVAHADAHRQPRIAATLEWVVAALAVAGMGR